MKVTLAKLSLCPCGFTVLQDRIALGAEYCIDPQDTIPADLQCGGCGLLTPHTWVWTNATPDSAAGYLPEGIFSHKQPQPKTQNP